MNNNQNITQQAQNYNAKLNMESSSELAQSQGQISQLLLAKAKSGGMEFGSPSLGSQNSNATSFSSKQLEIDQASGPITQILSGQSRQ